MVAGLLQDAMPTGMASCSLSGAKGRDRTGGQRRDASQSYRRTETEDRRTSFACGTSEAEGAQAQNKWSSNTSSGTRKSKRSSGSNSEANPGTAENEEKDLTENGGVA